MLITTSVQAREQVYNVYNFYVVSNKSKLLEETLSLIILSRTW